MSPRALEVGDAAGRRTAALILEVLAGLRSASEASEVLGMALARYYVLERRAVSGMIAGLAPRPRGRPRSDEQRVRALEGEIERLRGEVARLESLHRLSQRAIGVPSEPPKSAQRAGVAHKGGRRRAKPRAGRLLARLRAAAEEKSAPSRALPAESKATTSRGASNG